MQNNNNWSSEIKSIFDTCNMSHIFESRTNCDIKFLQTVFIGNFVENWKNIIDTSPKLRTYKLFKLNFGSECYLKSCIPRHRRSLLAQFRFGILPLHVETGRFTNVELCNRLCILCNSNAIEDEIHFICNCSFYDDLRKLLFDKVNLVLHSQHFDQLSSEEKLVILCNSFPNDLSKFIEYAFSRRKNFLYN